MKANWGELIALFGEALPPAPEYSWTDADADYEQYERDEAEWQRTHGDPFEHNTQRAITKAIVPHWDTDEEVQRALALSAAKWHPDNPNRGMGGSSTCACCISYSCTTCPLGNDDGSEGCLLESDDASYKHILAAYHKAGGE
jgi:hypothetical protein